MSEQYTSAATHTASMHFLWVFWVLSRWFLPAILLKSLTVNKGRTLAN